VKRAESRAAAIFQTSGRLFPVFSGRPRRAERARGTICRRDALGSAKDAVPVSLAHTSNSSTSFY